MFFSIATFSQEFITGPAKVLDADILKVGNNRVILWGIDAPERRQSCYKGKKKWACFEAARRTLQILSSQTEVVCNLIGEADPFGRRHGICKSGVYNINEQMIARGMALAFTEQTDIYLETQNRAIERQKGLWSIDVTFEIPWDFRKSNTPGGYR